MAVQASEQSIFLQAIAKPTPQERDAYLGEVCGADAELRAALRALVAAHERLGGGCPPTGPEPARGDSSPSHGVPTEPLVGGRYKLLRQLGEGGMGAVWLAEQVQPVQRQVALKIIKPGMDSRQVLARFEAERQALALMDHPNIARVLDAGATAAGRPFFVMELVKGQPITRYCDEHHFTARQRLDVFLRVCHAIQHAHQKGIIHRDIKPSNVLVSNSEAASEVGAAGLVKVIDFGVAKATAQRLTEKTLCTEAGAVIGTLEYMSPEQAELNNLDIDTRADIYSLGVVLYELLTGSPPFTGNELRSVTFTDMLRMIREVDPPKPSTRLSSSDALPAIAACRGLEPRKLTRLVQGDLDWIVMKCLEKDRSRRYETASALAADVQRYLADEPVLAGPPSAVYRLRKFLRRNQRPVVVTAFFLLFALSGLSVSGTLIWHAKRETDAALIKSRLAQKETERALKQAVENEQLAKENQHEADNERAKVEAKNVIILDKQKELERALAAVRAVDRYLIEDVLGSADPELALGQKLSVLEALTNAEKRLDGAFLDQPLVEASVRYTLGKTLYQLGEYERAEPHLTRTLELRERHLPADHVDTLRAMNSLGVAYQHLGKLEEALGLNEKALAGLEKALGKEDREVLMCQHNLGRLLRDMGRYQTAYRLIEETLTIRERVFGPADHDTHESQEALCTVLSDQGKWGEAQKRREEVIEQMDKVLAKDHPDLLMARNNLASVLLKRSKLKESQELFEQVVEARTRVLGPKHPKTLSSAASLAYVRALRGEIAVGRRKLAETFATLIEVLGEETGFPAAWLSSGTRSVALAAGSTGGDDAEPPRA